MFAVIKTGGKQYRVAEDQMLQIEKIEGEPGEIVQIGNVLMLGGDTPQFGSPAISGASVAAEVISQGRGPKVIAFKKRRRKNSRRKRGHRQEFTLIRITEILTGGREADQEPHGRSRSRSRSPPRRPKPARARARTSRSRGKSRPPRRGRPPRPSAQGKEKVTATKAKTHFVAPRGFRKQRSSIFVR